MGLLPSRIGRGDGLQLALVRRGPCAGPPEAEDGRPAAGRVLLLPARGLLAGRHPPALPRRRLESAWIGPAFRAQLLTEPLWDDQDRPRDSRKGAGPVGGRGDGAVPARSGGAAERPPPA